MNLIKIVLIMFLIGFTVNSKAQTNKENYRKVEVTSKHTVMSNNEKNEIIEVTIIKNGKKTTEQFASYEELKSTKKFDKLGVDVSHYFDIRNNQIYLNTNNIKITSISKGKKSPKKLTSVINIENDIIKINLEIKG